MDVPTNLHQCNLSHKITRLEQQLSEVTRYITENEHELQRQNQHLKQLISSLQLHNLSEYKSITHHTTSQMQTHIHDAQITISLLRQQLHREQQSKSEQSTKLTFYTDQITKMEQESKIQAEKNRSLESELGQVKEENESLKQQNSRMNEDVGRLLMKLDQVTNECSEEESNKMHVIDQLNAQNQLIQALRVQLGARVSKDVDSQTEEQNGMVGEQQRQQLRQVIKRETEEYQRVKQQGIRMQENVDMMREENRYLKEEIKQMEMISLESQQQMQNKHFYQREQMKGEYQKIKQSNVWLKDKIDKYQEEEKNIYQVIQTYKLKQIQYLDAIDKLQFQIKSKQRQKIEHEQDKIEANKVEKKISQKIVQFKKLAEQYEQLKENYRNLIGMQNMIKSKYQQIEKQFRKLQQQHKQTQINLKQKYNNYVQLQKYERIKKELQDKQTELENVIIALNELRNKNNLLTQQLSENQKTIKNLYSSIQEIRIEQKQKIKQINSFLLKLTVSSKQQTFLQNQLQEVKRLNDKLCDQAKRLKKQNQQWLLRLKRQQQQYNSKLQQINDTLNAQNEQLRSQYNNYKQTHIKNENMLAQTNSDLLSVLQILRRQKVALIHEFQALQYQFSQKQASYKQNQHLLSQQIRSLTHQYKNTKQALIKQKQQVINKLSSQNKQIQVNFQIKLKQFQYQQGDKFLKMTTQHQAKQRHLLQNFNRVQRDYNQLSNIFQSIKSQYEHAGQNSNIQLHRCQHHLNQNNEQILSLKAELVELALTSKQQLQEQSQHYAREINLLILAHQQKLRSKLQGQKEKYEEEMAAKERQFKDCMRQLREQANREINEKEQMVREWSRIRQMQSAQKIQTSYKVQELTQQLHHCHTQLVQSQSNRENINQTLEMHIRSLEKQLQSEQSVANAERTRINHVIKENEVLNSKVMNAVNQSLYNKEQLRLREIQIREMGQYLNRQQYKMKEEINRKESLLGQMRILQEQNRRLKINGKVESFDNSLIVSMDEIAKYKRKITQYQMNMMYLKEILLKVAYTKRDNSYQSENNSQWCIMQAAGAINKLSAECMRLKSELVALNCQKNQYQLQQHSKNVSSRRNTVREGVKKQQIQRISQERRSILQVFKKQFSFQ